MILTVATIGKEGYPHCTPVWFVVENGKLYFRANPSKQKVLNIRRNDRVCCSVEDGEVYSELRGAMITGRARLLTPGDFFNNINNKLLEKYRAERDYNNLPLEWRRNFENEDRVIVEATPQRVTSWDNRKWLRRGVGLAVRPRRHSKTRVP